MLRQQVLPALFIRNGLNATSCDHFKPNIPKEALIKEPPGNAQLFRLARRDLFVKQEWTLPSSTVSKK